MGLIIKNGVMYGADNSNICSFSVGTITLDADGWVSGTGEYTQDVTLTISVDADSKVDLQPDSTTIAQMIEDGTVGLFAVNTNGEVTIHAIGEAPSEDLTVQYTVATAGQVGNLNDLIQKNAGARNSVFRGNNLGSTVTADQWSAIQNGTFDGLFVGDYWEIPVTIDGTTLNAKWRIAHFDYWLHTGNTECTDHHVVIVPDICLYNAQMNVSNTTSGGYYGSAMRGGANYPTGGNLAKAKTAADSAFGSEHILTHYSRIINAVSGAIPSDIATVPSTIDLMNEVMVYGQFAYDSRCNGTTWPALSTFDKTQLSVFKLAPELIVTRSDWWLRDTSMSSTFVGMDANGGFNDYYSGNLLGVRPAFAIYKPIEQENE